MARSRTSPSSPARIRTLVALLAATLCAAPSWSLTNLFFEDFENVSLQPPADEEFLATFFPEAFTHNPPLGWSVENNLPGIGNPFVGVREWEGWSFANKDFWVAAAAGDPFGGPAGGREFFDLGQGTIAVADPDQWNDLGDPANELGFYNTLMKSPYIDFTPVRPFEDTLVLQFESSWIPGQCCNDTGSGSTPDDDFRDNQSAFVRAQLANGEVIEVLRWESAPFKAMDEFGQFTIPTNNPNHPTGTIPNPFFKPPTVNERVFVDLSFALFQSGGFSASDGEGSGGGAAAGGVTLEFGMEDAGDDGAWGMDNAMVSSFGTIDGDMDLSGIVDSADIDDFALGLRDPAAYVFSHKGQFPAARGDEGDGDNDFDDISWFVNVLETAGVSAPAAALATALRTVPEPHAALLSLLASACLLCQRRSVQR